MKLQRMIGLVSFLGLMNWMGQPTIWADAMQPPRFTLTDLGSVDGQAAPYSGPTGYTMQAVYSTDLYKPGYRIGWTFTKNGSTTNLLPDNMANDVNIPGYNLYGYSSSGIVFGDDLNTGSSFYFNTNTGDFGNFKGSGVYSRGITSMNSSCQALGLTWTTINDEVGNKIAWNIPTYYDSLMSDPVLLKDLITTSLGSWLLNEGAGINDNGQIFGKMFNTTTNQMDYYRLDPIPAPVPEPSTIMVFAASSLLVYARRRFSKNHRLVA